MKIKKADIVLAIIITFLGVILSFYLAKDEEKIEDGQVIIHLNNQIYGKYSLYEDHEIKIKNGNSINKVTIKDGNVQMAFSTCQNQDCVRQGKINDGSKSIICLPNKLVIEIKSKDKEYDSITR